MPLRRSWRTLPNLQRHQRRRRAADAGRLQDRGRQGRLAALSWSTRFDDPIELPNGRKLVTLEDAARYIQTAAGQPSSSSMIARLRKEPLFQMQTQ